jgi:hypothetical protein
MVAYGKVSQNHGPPSDRAMHAYFCTARNTDTAGNRGVRSNVDVMTDLNLVVQFDPIFDYGVI